MAGQLRELRNNYGSGHGRAYVPEVCKEILDVCVDAALPWCRWALRRLEFVIAGSPIALARDIRGPFVFYSGDVTRRLIAANLSNLPVADQHMLGVAVAHRAATGTFLVRIEGVEACASSTDQELWPPGYREGVVEGLFIGAVGSISVDVASVMNSALILSAHPAAEKAIEALLEKAIHASWSSAFAGNGAGRDAVNAAMQEYARLLVESAREPWGELRRLVTIQPD